MIYVALRPRTLVAAGGAVLVAVALTGCGSDPSDAPAEHKAFAFSGKTLTIDTNNSTIDLVPADVKSVQVTRHVDGWVFLGNGPDASWSMRDGTLSLKVKCSALVSSCASRHQIKVPRGVSVILKDNNGSVTAAGFDTSLKLRSNNGKVTVRDSSGALDLSSDNGAINADGVSSRQVTADSSNGAVRLSLTAVPDRVESFSNNGAVEITLPKKPGLAYKVETRSSNGSTQVGVPTDDASRHSIAARSDNGRIVVRSAN
ncbi:DUF4097 family beta strand repeat-containing protein [Streptomyces sp. NPDC090052]|uniref:DUF4097 family beta strand repeat-containing protein n=1 Tax=unclassified Streptomyces TaxID=2593676 RepID=UPI00225866F7|nr:MULTISPECIES: DUF4097 family beta strand repeat-containing protein [unclassified Streptomyces]MCX4726840.1 DUF4097 family beta strand repeat-containing protein [Streptomyces sp. NBC_01306]WSV03867.1 DUF4097 family beta strand repeat-containing protein [Streptomyces sp. NBC_01020]WSX41910.1 DUF4097 family beta strand repeat-containing protein [Streptomyces sp. NBC_00963]WSX70037.1 DUF4097 family beta strand repeat-containing protein [Streptomyces sp. NBC_00932]